MPTSPTDAGFARRPASSGVTTTGGRMSVSDPIVRRAPRTAQRSSLMMRRADCYGRARVRAEASSGAHSAENAPPRRFQ